MTFHQISRAPFLKISINVLIATAFLWCVWHSYIFLGLLYYSQGIDSAGLVDLIAKVAAGKGLVSPSYNSFYSALPEMFDTSSQQYCYGQIKNTFADASFMRWHPYLVAWLLALPVKLGATPLAVSKLSISISTFGFLFYILYWLHSQKVPLVLCILFVACIFAWAPWAQGAFGQFYFDRLFLLPMTAFIVLMHGYIQRKNNLGWAIVLLALLIDTISERPTIMLTGFLLGYPILYGGTKTLKDRRCWLLFALAIMNIIWLFYFIKYIQLDQTGSYTITGILNNFHALYQSDDPLYAKNLKLFAILLPFAILTLANWRMALIGIGAVVPNLFATIGGAEKTNFLTHYHSTYIPFLITAAAFGLLAMSNRWSQKRWFLPSMICALALIFFYNHYINDKDLTQAIAFKKPVWRYHTNAVFPFSDASVYSGFKEMEDQTKALAAKIPPGATVTMEEVYMPAVMEMGHEVNYLPVNLFKNDYVVAVYPHGSKMPSVTNYGPRKEEIQACYAEILKRSFKPIAEVNVGGNRAVVMKRNEAP